MDDPSLNCVFTIKEKAFKESAVSAYENTESLEFVSRLIPGALEKRTILSDYSFTVLECLRIDEVNILRLVSKIIEVSMLQN